MELNTSIHSTGDQSPVFPNFKDIEQLTNENNTDNFNYYKSIFLSNIFPDENINPNKESTSI